MIEHLNGRNQKSAIIIGAGLSGLATARALRDRGVAVTIVDASSHIADSWRVRHPQLRLNIHRHYAKLPGQIAPKHDGSFLRRDTVVEYLTRYAEGIDAPIHLETKVSKVLRLSSGWCLETNKGEFSCDHLIVATGRERVKTLPTWPGMDDFKREIIHSADLGDVKRLNGKKVLVVGAGNSGSDVLNHLSRSHPKQVWVAVRHGPAILPTRMFGFPLHRFAGVFARFPSWALDPAFALMQRLFIGDLRDYGLRRHAEGGGTRMQRDGITFALDDGFVGALKCGKFEAVSELAAFRSDSVELQNGSKIHPEVVICATGYSPGLQPLLGALGALNAKGYPLYPMGQRDPKNPGLWFTGYDVIFQGFFHAAGISAGRIASAIAMPVSGTQTTEGGLTTSAVITH